jgi:hypothetical protein
MFMAMPEAAMDLNGRMMSWQQNVWASGKAGHVQTIAQPETVQ